MKISSISLEISAVRRSQYPTDNKPEFLLVGRSNVGKSSFINTIIGRKNFARTSSNPGKTQTINYYLGNESFYLVDAPGYGFANRSQKELIDFGTMMEEYFHDRQQLRVCIQILDLRHGPTKDDLTMLDFVRSNSIPVLIVATKQDQCNQSETAKNRKMISEKCNVPLNQIVLFSSKTRKGRDELMNKIQTYLQ